MNAGRDASLRIATRASPLALWQANHVAELLRAAAPDLAVEVVEVTTSGDRDQTGALRSFGGVGVFTREVQKAVLDGRADIAVHSLKDLPTEPAPGLVLAAVPRRADTADALVLPAASAGAADLLALPANARLGTGSLRRRAQLLHARPDFNFQEVRGNVETRLKKLDAGECDALVLAVAGLTRLGLQGRISLRLVPPVMFPAVGQGALGIECREADGMVRSLLSRIEDHATRQAVTAERTLLATLRAGCHAPVGAATRLETGDLVLEAVVCSPDGKDRLHAQSRSTLVEAESLGKEVARILAGHGAEKYL